MNFHFYTLYAHNIILFTISKIILNGRFKKCNLGSTNNIIIIDKYLFEEKFSVK